MHVRDASHPSLSAAQFALRLRQASVRPGSKLMEAAAEFATTLGMAANELLHEAIFRLLAPKASRPDLAIEALLLMKMRSIASSMWRAKRRARESGEGLVPWDFVREQVPSTASYADPHRTLITRADRERFERILGSLADGDPKVAQLIDGVGFGLCGKKLCRLMGVSPPELATIRRRLKRRIQSVGML